MTPWVPWGAPQGLAHSRCSVNTSSLPRYEQQEELGTLPEGPSGRRCAGTRFAPVRWAAPERGRYVSPGRRAAAGPARCGGRRTGAVISSQHPGAASAYCVEDRGGEGGAGDGKGTPASIARSGQAPSSSPPGTQGFPFLWPFCFDQRLLCTLLPPQHFPLCPVAGLLCR